MENILSQEYLQCSSVNSQFTCHVLCRYLLFLCTPVVSFSFPHFLCSSSLYRSLPVSFSLFLLSIPPALILVLSSSLPPSLPPSDYPPYPLPFFPSPLSPSPFLPLPLPLAFSFPLPPSGSVHFHQAGGRRRSGRRPRGAGAAAGRGGGARPADGGGASIHPDQA